MEQSTADPNEANATPVYDLTELGTIVTQARKASGFTLSDASSRLGVSRRLLFELEHGRRSVGVDTVIRVLNMLGYDVVIRKRGGKRHA